MPRHTGSYRELSTKGVYVLLMEGGGEVSIGSLGERMFSHGWYGYIGSARGPGGFARVRRHHSLYQFRNRPPRWHIDYLLLDPQFRLRYALCGSTDGDYECHLASLLGPPWILGFGCGDCDCSSHLIHRNADPRVEIQNAMESLGMVPVIKTIKSHG